MFADFQQTKKRNFLAGLLISSTLLANNNNSSHNSLVNASKVDLEPLIFSKIVQGKEIPLLQMLQNNQVNQFALSDPFPEDFFFPRSFEFEMTLAQQY